MKFHLTIVFYSIENIWNNNSNVLAQLAEAVEYANCISAEG